jgi:hypothetical protein
MNQRNFSIAKLLPLLVALAAGTAAAQTQIDQAKAIAGGVTPGDAPYFPITISKPGSYKLTSNLDVPFQVNAIVIDADNVTLDLNGFEIRSTGVCERDLYSGVVSCNSQDAGTMKNAYSGIDINGTNAVIRNGTVSGFRGHGVNGHGGTWLDGMRIRHNRHHGVSMSGAGNRVTDSDLQMNQGSGLYGALVLVYGVTARENGDYGLRLSHSMVSRSMATQNRLSGLYGSAHSTAPTSVHHSQFQFNHVASEVSGNVVSGGGNFANASPF